MRQGIDIASYQHPEGLPIDYTKAVESGVKWVCVKVDEGLGYANPWLPQDLDGFTAAGAEVAVYHFAQPGRFDAQQSAKHFVECIPPAYRGVTRALDLEVSNGLSWVELARWAEVFAAAANTRLLYVNRSWQAGLIRAGIAWPGDWWIAAPSEDTFPPEAVVWQHDKGPVPGIIAACDLDLLPDVEETDMTPEEHDLLVATTKAVGDLTINVTNVSAAIDEIKSRLTALEAAVSAGGGGGVPQYRITLSGTAESP